MPLDTTRSGIALLAFSIASVAWFASAQDPPFGPDFPQLDSATTGEWWNKSGSDPKSTTKKSSDKKGGGKKGQGKGGEPIVDLNVPREQVVAFAVYTHDRGVLKLTAQLFPLKPDEPREARLELHQDGSWREVAKSRVEYPGWDAHFRIESWDNTKPVRYRVRHGENAQFEGEVRSDPISKDTIVVAVLSCNSSRTKGPREEIIDNLKFHDPDLLFFAGDQTYHHTQHTAGWLEFGLQFRDILRNRPAVIIPDDHDIGQGNLWGEGGKKSMTSVGHDGGYIYPAAYVNQVERAQTWHLPDPADPRPVEQGIGVYFTSLRVGGIDFAILEDRKFKSGPAGKIPEMGPRPDHINDPGYDRKAVDLPSLKLLGDRQMKWLDTWTQDWTGAQFKCVLSQTAFCGAVHLHGQRTNRLLADLDCNGWPQHGRNAALTTIRRAWAPHLCGDQHLAVVVKHGIGGPSDGPYGFTAPAIVNTIYGRWWHPADEQPGKDPPPGNPLPWTGDYLDGLGNPIRMLAYANPADVSDEKQRGDGYGLVRFNKKLRTMTFECWPRFASYRQGDQAQYPGWPMTLSIDDNDGREVVGWLPELVCQGNIPPVVQVIEDATGEVLYTVRAPSVRFRPRVYSQGSHSVRVGRDRPTGPQFKNLVPGTKDDRKKIEFSL